jgi:hypothetical protein
MFVMSKAADLNWQVEVGQLYRAFPFSKGSLPQWSILVGAREKL